MEYEAVRGFVYAAFGEHRIDDVGPVGSVGPGSRLQMKDGSQIGGFDNQALW